MPVAFCLVENKSGQVLLIQRGYGKEKYKWSLPGGNVDGKEGYQQAAARETREETGLRAKISTIMVGRTHAIMSNWRHIRHPLNARIAMAQPYASESTPTKIHTGASPASAHYNRPLIPM